MSQISCTGRITVQPHKQMSLHACRLVDLTPVGCGAGVKYCHNCFIKRGTGGGVINTS